jgi:hypothetical protein
MGGIDKEYAKRIIHYFLEGTDKKYEQKEVTLAPVGILTGTS